APGGLLAFLCAALTVLALAFSRNKVLLAPWVAVVCAMAGAELWAPRSLAAAGPPRSRAGAGSKTVARAGLMALRIAFVLCAVATAATGALLAESRRAAYDRDLSEALAFLRQHTAAGAAVAAPWWYGYETQAVAERPTVTDGLLESRENQRRILELFAAWVARDPAPLRQFCARYRVRYVLVPPPDEFTHVAWVTEPELAQHIAEGRSATPDELRRTLVRLMRR